jgi:arylsulfatase A-like enzyme
MLRPRRFAVLAALLFAPLCACSRAPGQRIVLLTLDTLRWDAFAGRDGAPGAMPHLAAWAEQGLVFERYYSATSTTQPTHASLFTGLHPWQHGLPYNGAVLAEEHATIPERLREQGYYTAAAVASFPVHHQFGWGQGFVEFQDELTHGDAEQWSGVDVEAEGFYTEAATIVDRAIELLDRAEGKRQFFWFHFYDPHAPYGDSSPGKGHLSPREILRLIKAGEDADAVCARGRRAYDKDVKYMDGELARLFERLDQERGFETHVIVVSDHGESFGEDQSLSHGKRLTPGQIHVPLIIRSPRVAPGRSPTAVGTIDVSATLLALAGISDLPAGSRDLTGPLGESIVMGMRRTYPERYVELRTTGESVVIAPDNRRFYLVEDGVCYVGGTGRVSIDDSEEPLEDPAREQELQQIFEGFARDFNAQGYEVIDDAATIETLRAMGYIGDDDEH